MTAAAGVMTVHGGLGDLDGGDGHRRGGVRWGLVTAGAVAAAAGGFCLWDRWATARLAPPDPGRVAELNRPRTAAVVASDLAGHISSILAHALLSAENRDRLVDLEWRLHLRSRGRRLEASSDLGPYAGVGIAVEVAVMEAERLLSGGPPWSDVSEWSPPVAGGRRGAGVVRGQPRPSPGRRRAGPPEGEARRSGVEVAAVPVAEA